MKRQIEAAREEQASLAHQGNELPPTLSVLSLSIANVASVYSRRLDASEELVRLCDLKMQDALSHIESAIELHSKLRSRQGSFARNPALPKSIDDILQPALEILIGLTEEIDALAQRRTDLQVVLEGAVGHTQALMDSIGKAIKTIKESKVEASL